MIETAFADQKQVASTLNIPQFPQVSEQITKKSEEITSNVIRSAGIFNQLSVNALDAVTDFNNNLLKTWTSYWSAQQQQFYRA
jgi:hypothetical protein